MNSQPDPVCAFSQRHGSGDGARRRLLCVRLRRNRQPRCGDTATLHRLNQYNSRAVPGKVDVLGVALPDAAVTVKVGSVTAAARRQGEYYSASVPVGNNNPVWKPVSVSAVQGAASGDLQQSIGAGSVYVPPAQENFFYDGDGNLRSDSRFDYEWDAENRLRAVTTRALSSAPDMPRIRLTFAYDAQGRRVEKALYRWNAQTASFGAAPEKLSRFFYDGWNLLEEIVGTPDAAQPGGWLWQRGNRYYWGLDLSGSVEEAGGVGGLLGMATGNTVYVPGYDGNGNVVALMRATGNPYVQENGAVYEYGPFGETVRSSGAMANGNPFRFSTQYTDVETGLVMYVFRPYCPASGRWLSRDPIEEEGGENLYGFVLNNPVNHIDLLGLKADGTRPCGTPQMSSISMHDGTVDVQLWKCAWCCDNDGKSKTSNVGQQKTFYTIQLVLKLKGKISLRNQLLKRLAYGRGIVAVVSQIESHTDQRFGDFGLRYKGEATFKVNWDGCLEKITGGKTVTFNVTPEAYADANIGSSALGWYATGKAAAGGTVQGKIYMAGRSVMVEGRGALHANGSYSLGWKEQNSKGNWYSRSSSGSVSDKWTLFDNQVREIYTLPID